VQENCDSSQLRFLEPQAVQLVQSTALAVRRDRLLRLPDVEAVTGLKKSTLYLLMRREAFPASIQVTPRCVAWSEAAVLTWIQQRISSGVQPVGSEASQ
jgi:prophage regulatory protein